MWMENISKSFPGVRALDDVSLHVGAGEVLGLIGQNGAGKSTLMKILSGVYSVDEGEIYLEGQPVHITDPHQAQELGIAIIYQELNLMPNLTVMENILIGREPGPPIFFNRGKMVSESQAILDRLKLDLSPKSPGAHSFRGRTADGRDRQDHLAQGQSSDYGRAHLRA